MFRRDPEIVLLFLACFTSFLTSCGFQEGLPAPEPPLRAYFIDVGQGDACLLRAPTGEAWLYDLGNQDSLLDKFLRRMDLDTLEGVLISHPDLDHFGAFTVLKTRVVKRWYLPETNSPDPAWARLLAQLDARDEKSETLHQGDTLRWAGRIGVKALWPPPGFSGSDNDLSLVLRVTYGAASLLLTGDVEAAGEAGMLASGVSLKSDLLKVAHHGSRTSSSLPLLAAVSPRLAVISCDSLVYGHPHAETLAGLRHFLPGEGRIFRTDVEGTVAFEMDGEGLRRIPF
jgi:beta-lactamase superfamily II metal-dependent hydrolase